MARANVYVPAHVDQLRNQLGPSESLSSILTEAMEMRFGMRTRTCEQCGAEQPKAKTA